MTIGEKLALVRSKGMRSISEDAYVSLRGDANPPPSDEVANGDKAEDKQLEDEDDPEDDITDDNGFVNSFKSNRQYIQTSSPPSDEVANGDRDEDRQLEDEEDPDDDIVDDNGFVNASKNNRELMQTSDNGNHDFDFGAEGTIKAMKHAGSGKVKRYSDQLANGDRDDDRDLEDESDRNDAIVDENFYVNLKSQGVLDGPWTMPSFADSIHGVPLYSDELANGDSADDRDIHNEDDMNDDVVDYNGGTSRGYGAIEPQRRFVENNHILSGSHNNGPRYTGDSWASSLANPLAKGGNL
jgi:hypothetical protein